MTEETETIIYNQVKQCYAILPGFLALIKDNANSVQCLDSILNQLEQRKSIVSTDFTNCPLRNLPSFRQKLLLKVDCHLTELLGQVRKDLERINCELNRLEQLYQEAELQLKCNKSLNGDDQQNLATENRPSCNDLMKYLDEIITFMRENLDKKLNLIENFDPVDIDSAQTLRRSWKLRWSQEEKFNYAIFVCQTLSSFNFDSK